MLMNNGTWMTFPVSRVAGLRAPLTRSPCMPGDDVTVVERDDRDRVLDHVVGGVAEGDRRHVLLVVALEIHEHVLVAVAVEELHVLAVEDGLLDADTRIEGAVDDGARAHVANLGTDERAALARLDVLELDDLEQDAVQFEGDPVLQVVGGDGGHGESFGDVVRTRHPSLVTTTRSSTRTPPKPSR